MQTVSIMQAGHKQGVTALAFDKEGHVRIYKWLLGLRITIVLSIIL